MKKKKKKTKYRDRARRENMKKQTAAWADAVKERDGHACVVCQKTTGLQAHHLLAKYRWSQYRTEISNGITLCAGHHSLGKYSFHLNAVWAALWLQAHRPDQYQWVVDRLADFEKEN